MKRLQRGVPVVPAQDDLLHETLTVWEVLYYAAMLRLPQGMSHEAKKRRVDDVITALGIQACKGTIIGAGSVRVHAARPQAILAALLATAHPGTASVEGAMCMKWVSVEREMYSL